MNSPLDVVVIGAGVGGLGSALGLARAGHHVTVVERDDTPMPGDVEGAFEWARRGAPQVRHPHAFLGLARTILRDRYPDVLEELSELGVHTVAMTGDGAAFEISDAARALLDEDDDIELLACRRTTFEWVMRRRVLAEPNIDFRVGDGVSRLLVADEPPRQPGEDAPVVVGVELEDGSVLHADLVVAATGRRGDVPGWLAPLGVEVPESTLDTGAVYFSRFYRSDSAADFGFRGGIGRGLVTGVIGADAGTYSVTAVVDKDDRELRAHLGDSDRFDATMRMLPELADVAEAGGVPMQPVHCMTGLVNRLRRFTDRMGEPLMVGLMVCGDAHTCTNPAYGRGQSLALLQSTMIVDALAEAGDLRSAGRAYEAGCAAKVEPWYHFSVMTDGMRTRRPSEQGATERRVYSSAGIDFASLMAGIADDPEMVRTVVRVMNLLESPNALFELLPRIADADRPAGPPPAAPPRPPRPSRDEMLAVLA